MKTKRPFPAAWQQYYHTPGTAPGTLISRGDDHTVLLEYIEYSAEHLIRHRCQKIEECFKKNADHSIRWINIEGIPAPDVLETLATEFGLHRLALEDVLNGGQRSKLEEFDNHSFLIMHLLDYTKLDLYPVNIFIGSDYIITIEPKTDGAFNSIYKSLEDASGDLRRSGPDYLCYIICDALMDRFFPGIGQLREQVDNLETRVFSHEKAGIIEDIHNLKVKLMLLEKILWQELEVIDAMRSEGNSLFKSPTRLYLRDTYDHTLQLLHALDSYRQLSSSILEAHLSMVSNEMNQVMKVLTIIATIFIPLTFISGVYGMNFNPAAGPLSMPELNWAYGYVGILGFMVVLTMVMLIFFRRKKWM